MASKIEKAVTLMVTTNMSQREIASEVDVNEATLSRWKKQDKFKALFEVAQQDFLLKMTAPAMRTLKSLLHADNEAVRLNAAKDILDRTGFKPTTQTELSGNLKIDIPVLFEGYEDVPD